MRKIQFLIPYTLGIVVISILATLLVVSVVRNATIVPQVVNNDVVIERIKNQSFLVTKTIYTDQTTDFKIDQGSAWSNFFWGKQIVAKARIRTDYGLDLQKLTSMNISVDSTKKTITITNISPTILNTSIYGDLNIENNCSILRKLLASDPNGDYSLAADKLTSAANRAIINDEGLTEDTKSSTTVQLNQLFKDTGYSISWN